MPESLPDLIRAGGPESLVREAARAAATEARRFWLDVLERLDLADCDVMSGAMFAGYIRDLRRRLGVGPSAETVREQTRERVRRFRERQRTAASTAAGLIEEEGGQ
jgi:hypothetical protein